MPAPALTLAPPDPTSPTILVVAPEVGAGLEITRALGTAGHRAHVLTRGGAAARKAIDRLDPDAVFCHVDLLGSGGDRLLASDSSPLSPHPVVVVVPPRREVDALAAINDGALASLPTPINSKSASRALGRALQRRRLLAAADPSRDGQPDVAPTTSSTDASLYADAVGQLYMAWQPLVDAGSAALYGYEALVRSDAPCCPSAWHVLQLAARLGMTADLQERIRRRIARELSHGGLRGVITVNVTVDDLLRSSLGSSVDPLRRYADRIVLEVVEDGPIDSIEEVALAASRLRSHGYRIALDDLGAGCETLPRLVALHPDIIKIDRLALTDCDRDPRKQGYIRTVVALAHAEQALVVAEGIERPEEAATARALGCDLLQGYLVSRPQRRSWWLRHAIEDTWPSPPAAPRADAA